MTGVRAYERRADLRAHNQRLLDYARAGGTVIVQYNKFEFNDAQYGPYPAKVGRERVTDENAELKLLAPHTRCSTNPTRLAAPTGPGGCRSAACTSSTKPGVTRSTPTSSNLPTRSPYNQGAKRGALVEAKVGQGRWIYVGLGLWRQLPAGTDGAYRLMANLMSLPKK